MPSAVLCSAAAAWVAVGATAASTRAVDTTTPLRIRLPDCRNVFISASAVYCITSRLVYENQHRTRVFPGYRRRVNSCGRSANSV